MARAHPHERKEVRGMVVDRPVVHKIPMVRISAKDADRRTCDVKGLDMSISKDMNKSKGHR